MKKTAIAILLLLVFLFVSCDSNDDSTDPLRVDETEAYDGYYIESTTVEISYETREEYGSILPSNYAVYKNYVFWVKDIDFPETNKTYSQILYQNTANQTEGGRSLLYNPDSADPYGILSENPYILRIVVDEYATERNNGIPILIITYVAEGGDTLTVVSFDMKTRETKVITNGIQASDGFVYPVLLYGANYYIIDEWINNCIYSVNIDTGEVLACSLPENASCYVIGAEDGKIIISSWNDSAENDYFYVCTPDLEIINTIQATENAVDIVREQRAFVYNGYIYYQCYIIDAASLPENTYGEVYTRIPVDGSSGPEPVKIRVDNGKCGDGKLYYINNNAVCYINLDTFDVFGTVINDKALGGSLKNIIYIWRDSMLISAVSGLFLIDLETGASTQITDLNN